MTDISPRIRQRVSQLPSTGRWLAIALAFLCAWTTPARGDVRIEAITDVEGVRINQLSGMGLVVGLNGTGGTSPVTRQFAQNFLLNFGIRATPAQRLLIAEDTRQRTDNVSVVTVTAQLPIFARQGSHIDVTVSAFDDASSLLGGTLIMTPLMGADGRVYAVASGAVNIGGFSLGGDATVVQKNHPTTGKIANGATVEEQVATNYVHSGSFRLLLRDSSFVTAERISTSINRAFPGTAHAEDAGAVNVIIPTRHSLDPVKFLSHIHALEVNPDQPARIVINERTGTVVIGHNVRVSAAAIAHGNLSIITTETPEVSQPAPLSDGQTAIVPRTQVEVVEESSTVSVFGPTATVGDLSNALNQLGVTPRDLSAIFQQLHSAGALHGQLIIE